MECKYLRKGPGPDDHHWEKVESDDYISMSIILQEIRCRLKSNDIMLIG